MNRSVCFVVIGTGFVPPAMAAFGQDCDPHGALNILDFICFQEDFQAGCE